MEAAIADMPRFLPRVDGAPSRPAFVPRADDPPPIRADLDVHLDRDALELELRLCAPGRPCTAHIARGHRLHPERIAHQLASAVAAELGAPPPREPPPGQASADDYAVLLLGRAAATTFGLLPLPANGDEDPVARALRVDQAMSIAHTLAARTASESVPSLPPSPRPSDLADRAAALDQAAERAWLGSPGPEPAATWAAWRAYDERAPADPRFAVARALAAARAGDREAALAALGQAPLAARSSPATRIALEVALIEAGGGHDEEKLAAWQELAPLDPAPVRRRLAAALADGRHHDALALTEPLAAAGATEEALRMTLALATHLGDRERAAVAALALGRDELARRLQAAAHPAADALLAGATSPELRLYRAERMLKEAAPRAALEEVGQLLAEHPWWPEAHDVERRAHLALGDRRRADAAAARVLQIDPLFFDSRSSEARISEARR